MSGYHPRDQAGETDGGPGPAQRTLPSGPSTKEMQEMKEEAE